MIWFFLTIILFLDRGVWSYLRPDVNVYEPGQKAVIAFNRGIEIMILSNDLYADTDTKVLEILPLPGLPQIDSSNVTVFYRIQEKIQEFVFSLAENMALGLDESRGKGIKEIFHKRIGPHGLTVVQIRNLNDFKNWLEDFLRREGVEKTPETAPLESLIKVYIDDKINYFVFDVIEVGTDPLSVVPLKFRFRTDRLYFPLRITSLAKGSTKIQLFLLTKDIPDLFRNYPLKPGMTAIGIPIEVKLSPRDLYQIDPDFARLFSKSAYLTALHYEGPVEELIADLKIKRYYRLVVE